MLAAPDTIQEDCRKALRDLPLDSVDCVVTGVPFWSDKPWGWKGAIGGEASFTDYLLSMREVFGALWPVVRASGHLWVVAGDCRNRPTLAQAARLLPLLESVGWKLRDTFIWSYKVAVPQFQTVYWFQKEPLIFRPRIPTEFGFVWDLPLDQGDPVTFPEALVERCLELSAFDTPARVLDPFAGSGTVGRVARRLGYSAVMIDGRDHA
jgi:DNA modification methylase